MKKFALALALALGAAAWQAAPFGQPADSGPALAGIDAGGAPHSDCVQTDSDWLSGCESDELRRRLHRELQELPESLRAPVVLYDIEGLSYGEIAEILEVAEGTVKSRIHRARQALRARLGDLVREQGERS